MNECRLTLKFDFIQILERGSLCMYSIFSDVLSIIVFPIALFSNNSSFQGGENSRKKSLPLLENKTVINCGDIRLNTKQAHRLAIDRNRYNRIKELVRNLNYGVVLLFSINFNLNWFHSGALFKRNISKILRLAAAPLLFKTPSFIFDC